MADDAGTLFSIDAIVVFTLPVSKSRRILHHATKQATMNSWPKSRRPRDVGRIANRLDRRYTPRITRIGPVTSARSVKQQIREAPGIVA